MTNQEKALQYLCHLVVNQAYEYPDAHSAACSKFNIMGSKRQDALRDAYDAWCVECATRKQELDSDLFHPVAE